MIVTDPRRADKGGKPVSYYEDILNEYGVKMAFTNHPKQPLIGILILLSKIPKVMVPV